MQQTKKTKKAYYHIFVVKYRQNKIKKISKFIKNMALNGFCLLNWNLCRKFPRLTMEFL